MSEIRGFSLPMLVGITPSPSQKGIRVEKREEARTQKKGSTLLTRAYAFRALLSKLFKIFAFLERIRYFKNFKIVSQAHMGAWERLGGFHNLLRGLHMNDLRLRQKTIYWVCHYSGAEPEMKFRMWFAITLPSMWQKTNTWNFENAIYEVCHLSGNWKCWLEKEDESS